MTYTENQIFINEYPTDCAQWCNKNDYCIKEITKQGDSRRFQIQKVVVPLKTKAEQIEELKVQLVEIDNKKIRPTSAIALGIATAEDTTKLQELEQQAQEIRKKIQKLGE